MSAALSGLRVLVTRPARQAENLCRQLEQHGAEAVRLPLFVIEPAGDVQEQSRLMAELREAEAWIFTSANAVRHAAERDGGPWPMCYAVGSATADALRDLGRGPVSQPAQGSTSEALLDMPALREVGGSQILIVTGEGGRDLLASTLASRGANVDTLTLYRRRPIEYGSTRIIAEVELADASILTSGEALQRLWELTPEPSRRALLMQQLVLPSERVREQARELGFAGALVPSVVSDDAIVDCLIQWRQSATTDAPMTSTPSSADVTPAAAAPRPAPTRVGAAPTPVKRPGRALGITLWLFVLLLAGAAGYAGWTFWNLLQDQASLTQAHDHALRQLSRQAGDLENQSAQLSTRQSDLARVLQREGTDVASLQGRIEASEQLMGRISDELQGGRTRFALASIEQLLLLANDRLLLERDIRSALLALQMADERLGQINDPRLFRVRQAIADERTRLQALPRPDLTSASLTLSSLIDRADSLPLRSRVAPKQFGGRRSLPNAVDAATTHWAQRAWNAIREAAAGLFLVRRDDNAATLRMLPVEDEAVLVHVLVLKLESARVALLRGETAAFREAARSATDWLRRYFRADDPGVIAALAELERVQPLELSAPPPDITESLTLLRQLLDQRAGEP